MRQSNHRRWMEKSRHKFKYRFSYEKTFKGYKTQKGAKVTVFCNSHKREFQVFPDKHIQSNSGGCKDCEKEQRLKSIFERERTKFLTWSDGNLREQLVIKSKFKGMTSNIKVSCLIHKTTKNTLPTFLMNERAYGCDKCAREATSKGRRLSLEDVQSAIEGKIPEHIQILSIRFSEKTRTTSVKLNCEIHGEKNVTPGYLKSSNYLCPECGKEVRGYTETRLSNLINKNEVGRPTLIGVMEVEVYGIKSLKVGITTRTLQERYAFYLKNIFFSVTIDEIDAITLENQVTRNFRDHHDLRIIKKGMRSGERWAGDTELYWFNQETPIIRFIKKFVKDLKMKKPDYEAELRDIIIHDFFPIDVSREKDLSNQPVAVVAVDPATNKVIHEFESISAAKQAGYRNISLVLSNNSSRQYSGGLRWFRRDNFDPKNIPEINPSNIGLTIRCCETNELFHSTIHAEQEMRSKGYAVNSSKITSVIKGNRKHTAGFSWESAGVSHQEVESQDRSKIIDFKPPPNSNSKKVISLYNATSGKLVKQFDSQSAAARYLGTSAGNIKRAMDRNALVKNHIARKG